MGTRKRTSGKEKAAVPVGTPSFSAPGSRSRGPRPEMDRPPPKPSGRPGEYAGRRPARQGPAASSGPHSAPAGPDTSASKARQKYQRKRRRARVYLAVSIFVMIFSIVAAGTVFFKVEQFAVYGNSHYTPEEIIEATGVFYEDNLFLMDKFKIIDNMLSNMIFLESVEIRRVLPGTLKITVKEVAAAGAIESGGVYWLCDQTGRLLERRDTAPDGTALVVGVALAKPSAGRVLQTEETEKQQPLLAVLPALSESGLAPGVTKISLERVYDLTVWYGEGFEILLGKSEGLPDKCRRLALLLAQLESQGQTTARIDASGASIHVLP